MKFPLAALGTMLTLSALAASSTSDNTLRWKVQEERQQYGYLIYRSEHREGPFVRINPHVVRVKSPNTRPLEYRYVDAGLTTGKTYYYRVDSVSSSGMKQQIGPVLAKVAGGPKVKATEFPQFK